MGLLSTIFAGPKSIDKAMDAAIATGDKLVFTKEEKAAHKAKMADWFLRYLEATQPQNLARRFLAVIVAGLWAGMTALTVIVGIIEYLMGIPEMPIAGWIYKVLKDIVLVPFGIVMAFYFAGHYLKQIANGKK